MTIEIFFSQAEPSFTTWLKNYGSIISPPITIFIAWFTAWLTTRKYFQEQKTERLQKLYYVDAIIKPLERLEDLLLLVNRNSCLFTKS